MIRSWLLLLVALALASSGCTHPWNVNAHAAINAHAHLLDGADHGLAVQIRADADQDGAVIAHRYGAAVVSLRAAALALREAERIVDAAERVQDASEHCRALVAVQEAVVGVGKGLQDLAASGLTPVAADVTQAAQLAVALGPAIAAECKGVASGH